MIEGVLLQVLKALGYYAVLVIVMRVAGKRLAGQTTSFDLVILIQLAVVIQDLLYDKSPTNAFVFVVTVLTAHRLIAAACARHDGLRHFIRGAPRPLVQNGVVMERALAEERMSQEELLVGLRKLGYASPEEVETAFLEETGHVSAIARTPRT